MIDLFFVRHPPYSAPIEGLCIGQTDLEPEAIPTDFPERLAEFIGDVDTIHSSDLRRCRAVSEPLAQVTGKPISTTRLLRELNFGDWDGRAWNELRAAHAAQVEEWMADIVTVVPPGGESFEQLAMRAEQWRQSLAPGRFAVVSHGGVIRALLAVAIGLPLKNAFRIGIDYLSVTHIRWGANVPPKVCYTNFRL